MRKHYGTLLQYTMISLLHYGKISFNLSFFLKKIYGKKITLKQKHINYLIPSIFVKFHKPYFYLQEKKCDDELKT